MKRLWKKINTERVFTCPYIKVDTSVFEDDLGFKDDFYSLPFGDWVHVIPEVSKGKLLMIDLYRFGVEDVSLEFPGGQIESGITPEESAIRELVEETGYSSSENLVSLGWSYPNPAIQKNKCYYYIAKNCKKIQEQNLEPAEDISVKSLSLEQVEKEVLNGNITHSLALIGYYKYANFILKNEKY